MEVAPRLKRRDYVFLIAALCERRIYFEGLFMRWSQTAATETALKRLFGYKGLKLSGMQRSKIFAKKSPEAVDGLKSRATLSVPPEAGLL